MSLLAGSANRHIRWVATVPSCVRVRDLSGKGRSVSANGSHFSWLDAGHLCVCVWDYGHLRFDYRVEGSIF